MEQPLITTIIPTFRRPQLLKRAIISALSQTSQTIQIRVYDNASEDETEAVVREFMRRDSRIKYHCHSKNIGMLANYQYSLTQIDTPYFSFLSDDDVLFPWFYEEALKGICAFPECAFSACSTLIMTEKGKVIHVPFDSWKKQGYLTPPHGLLEMIPKYPIPTCVLFNKKFVDKVAIDMRNTLTWDCDFLMQIAARFPIFISKRPCGIFLQHKASFSNAQGYQLWDLSLRSMIERINQQSFLSLETKRKANLLIVSHLRTLMRHFVLQALISKKFDEAGVYVKKYRSDFGNSFEIFLFSLLIPFCEFCRPLLYLFLFLRRIKRMIKIRSPKNYQHYAKWLEN